MSDLTGLTNPAKRLIKSSIIKQVPDPAPVISPVAEAQNTSTTYRGDTLVPVPATYSVTAPRQTDQQLLLGPGQPDRWVLDDNGNYFYIPRSDYTFGRIP